MKSELTKTAHHFKDIADNLFWKVNVFQMFKKLTDRSVGCSSMHGKFGVPSSREGQMVRRVLIAEDDVNVREGIEAVLKVEGFEVASSGNGWEALEKLESAEAQNQPFDLLIADHQMPGMTGLELVIELNRSKTSLPTVVITGHGEKALMKELIQRDFSSFLEKPFQPQELIEAVKNSLRRKKENSGEGASDLQKTYEAVLVLVDQFGDTLNNFLTVIIGYTELLKAELPPHAVSLDALEGIRKSAFGASEQLQQLLMVSKHGRKG